jgi:hypothetical protein
MLIGNPVTVRGSSCDFVQRCLDKREPVKLQRLELPRPLLKYAWQARRQEMRCERYCEAMLSAPLTALMPASDDGHTHEAHSFGCVQ